MTLDTITRAEFEQRLDASNERLRQELAEAQERVQGLEILIARKEAFAHKLDRMLTEIEQEEAAIALFEKELRPYNPAKDRRGRTRSLSL
jgi:hypothetical protein